MQLLEAPDLQAVDVEVLLSGEGLVVEGGTAVGGSPVQLSIQPETQLTTGEGIGGERGKENRGT